MSTAPPESHFLTAGEVSDASAHPLSQRIVAKADAYIADLLSQHEAAAAAAARDALGAQHLLQQAERRAASSASSASAAAARADDLERQLEDAQASLSALQRQVVGLEARAAAGEAELVSARGLADSLQADKASLLKLLEVKGKDVERLIASSSESVQRLATASASASELEAALREAQAGHVADEFALARAERERDRAVEHAEWLSTELEAKGKDLLGLRKDLSALKIQTQVDAEEAAAEAKALRKALDSVRGTLESKTDALSDAHDAIRQLKDEVASKDAAFARTHATQSRLIELYKDEAEHERSRASALQQSIDELNALVDQTEAAHAEQVAQLTADRVDLQKKLSDALAHQDDNLPVETSGSDEEPQVSSVPRRSRRRRRDSSSSGNDDDDDDDDNNNNNNNNNARRKRTMSRSVISPSVMIRRMSYFWFSWVQWGAFWIAVRMSGVKLVGPKRRTPEPKMLL